MDIFTSSNALVSTPSVDTDGRSAGSSLRDWASRGLFTGVAMVTGLVCSNALLGRLSIWFVFLFFL